MNTHTHICPVKIFACFFFVFFITASTHIHTQFIIIIIIYYFCLKHSKSTRITIVIIAVTSNHTRVAPLGPHRNSKFRAQNTHQMTSHEQDRTSDQESLVIINTVTVREIVRHSLLSKQTIQHTDFQKR